MPKVNCRPYCEKSKWNILVRDVMVGIGTIFKDVGNYYTTTSLNWPGMGERCPKFYLARLTSPTKDQEHSSLEWGITSCVHEPSWWFFKNTKWMNTYHNKTPILLRHQAERIASTAKGIFCPFLLPDRESILLAPFIQTTCLDVKKVQMRPICRDSKSFFI